jgi:hypothetical protein
MAFKGRLMSLVLVGAASLLCQQVSAQSKGAEPATRVDQGSVG